MTATHSTTRRTVLTVAKIALAVAILAYLVVQARHGFSQLSEQTIQWKFLAAALVATLSACTLSFVRWHLLINALGISMRLVDTLRLGALGFALNFVSPGSIGGDFFKAIFLAHGHPGKRTEAVATVVADRVIGLLTMLVLASVGILSTGLLTAGSPALTLLCRAILLMTAVSWIGFGLLLLPRSRFGAWVIERAEAAPVVGKTIARLLETVDVYRSQKPTLLAAFSVSLGMALCFITSFYLVARGLPIHEPPWAEHLVIVPVAGLVGAIPLTPSGLGTLELAVEELYKTMPGGTFVNTGDGTLVALGRRVTEMAVALIGLVYCLGHRREVREVFVEAEEAADMV